MSTSETYTIVVIDDVRTPLGSTSDDIIVFTYRTPEEGLEALKLFHNSGRKLNELWLDHDMGIDPASGYDITIAPVVRWLEEIGYESNPLDVGWIFIHTSNPYAAEGMERGLKTYYTNVMRSDLPLADHSR